MTSSKHKEETNQGAAGAAAAKISSRSCSSSAPIQAAATITTTATPLSVADIDRLFVPAAAFSAAVWFLMVLLSYAAVPRAQWVYLHPDEQRAAALAFYVMCITILLVSMPLLLQSTTSFHSSSSSSSRSWSGIVKAALVVLLVAAMTNALLAFFPTIILVDPITRARVFLIRWCEWTPLAGLMTFLAESADLSHVHIVVASEAAPAGPTSTTKKRTTKETSKELIPTTLRDATLVSLWQSLSCLCGYIFPFCKGNVFLWSCALIVSVLTYATIFPRLYIKRQNFLKSDPGTTFLQMELYDRIRFAYFLTLTCTIVWTVLVVMYFVNIALHHWTDEGHRYRGNSFSMVVDTAFDVLAKAIYMKLIVDVHSLVFDAEARAERQLTELRKLMATLWEKSSDAIIISVKHNQRTTTMISPSFSTLLGAKLPRAVLDHRKSTALMLETDCLHVDDGNSQTGEARVVVANYVDSAELPYGGALRNAILAVVEPDSLLVEAARILLSHTWKAPTEIAYPPEGKSHLILLLMDKVDGTGELNCEIKVSRQYDSSLVAVVRDVTERYIRFEAERRVHAEVLARQREAKMASRFVRHEIKNGLLAGIELCDGLANAFTECYPAPPTENETGRPAAVDTAPTRTRNYIEELDHMLHGILDTVLAESMARDVVNEVYRPRLERVHVPSLLQQVRSHQQRNSGRFSVECVGAKMPYLMLDPQLFHYIHRNAVSNAVKYGKQPNGKIITRISYDFGSEAVMMEVVNEPGDAHDKILALGDAARDVVFAPGSRLNTHDTMLISSGDGAWIMSKCAKTMGGECDIRFLLDRTIFSLTCPAAPLMTQDLVDVTDFEVPAGTWGVAVDDSKIQRKLLGRILGHVGIDEARCIILGRNKSEVYSLHEVISDLLAKDPDSKILVLVDENLDFGQFDKQGDEDVVLSGSKITQSILRSLCPSEESRILALVRSANDSSEDLAFYSARTHGCFPKSSMLQERVREILAPLWADRFFPPQKSRAESVDSIDHSTDSDDMLHDELRRQIERIDQLLLFASDESAAQHWPSIWSALHSLKGDLMVLDCEQPAQAIAAQISALRGNAPPEHLSQTWKMIRDKLDGVVLK